MNCVPTKEQHLQFYKKITSDLLAKAKAGEPVEVKSFIGDIYDKVLDKTGDIDLALTYAGLAPQYMSAAMGLNTQTVGKLLKNEFGLLNDLETAFKDNLDAVHAYVIEPVIDQESIANQVKNNPTTGTNIPNIPKEDVKVTNENNNSAIPGHINITTGQEGEIINGKQTNIIKSSLKVPMLVRDNILSQMELTKTSIGSDLLYSFHQGFKLRLMDETQLPANSIESGKVAQKENLVLAITDNDGNFLKFNDKGFIEPNGVVVHFTYRIPNSSKTLNNHATWMKEFLGRMKENLLKKGLTEEVVNNIIKEQKVSLEKVRDIEIDMSLTALDNYNATPDEVHLMNITGGEIGYVPTPLKGQAWANMSDIKVTDDELGTITYTASGGSSIQFNGISKRTTIQGLPLDNAAFSTTIDNIVRVLTSDKVSNEDKINYLKNFILTTTNPKDKKVKTFITVNSETGKLMLGIEMFNFPDLLKADPLKVTEALLNSGIWFNINATKISDVDFTDIYIDKEGNAKKTIKSYRNLVKAFTKANTVPNEEGNVVQLNGYFAWEPINTETKEITAENIKTSEKLNNEEDDLDFLMSQELLAHKLIELATTPEQQKIADKWWANSPLSKAKDAKGNLLIPYERLRDIVNSNAFATWSLAGIKIFNGGDSTHVYHESWHAFSQLFLSKEDKNKLYTETAKMKGTFKVIVRSLDEHGHIVPMLKEVEFATATKRQLEEYIAEAFRNFAISKGTKATPVKAMKSIFQKIMDFLKALFTGVTVEDTSNDPKLIKPLADMFNALYVGDINNYTASVDNVSFSIANAGMISISNLDDELTAQQSKVLNDSIDGIISETIATKALTDPNWTTRGLIKNENKILLYKIAKVKLFHRYVQLLKVKQESGQTLTPDELEKLDKNPKALSTKGAHQPIKTADDLQILSDNLFLLNWAVTNFGNIEESINNSNKKDKEPGVVSHSLLNSAFNNLLAINKVDETDFISEAPVTQDAEKDALEQDEQVIAAKKRSEYGDHGPNSVNPFEEADARVVYLVKSLLRQNEKGEVALNSLGFPELVNYSNAKNNLEKKLTGIPHPSGLYLKMNELAEHDLLYVQLLLRMGVPDSGNTEQDDLWLAWTRTLSRVKQPLITNNIEITNTSTTTETGEIEEGETTVLYKAGIRASSNYHRVKSNWYSEFKQRVAKNDPYTLSTAENTNYLDLDAIKKEFLLEDTKKDSINYVLKEGSAKAILFLKALGFNITASPVTIQHILSDADIMRDIGFLVNAVGYIQNKNSILRSNGAEEQIITNPIDTFGSHNYGTQTFKNGKTATKSIDAQGGLINSLAKLEADNSDQYSSTSKLNAVGDAMSEIAKQSTISKIIYALQTAANRNDFSNPDSYYKYMAFLSRLNNPYAKSSVIMNSLYSAYNGNRSGEIALINLSGTGLFEKNGNNQKEKGATHASMTIMDKFITDFNTALLSGVMAHPTTGGKSTHYATKVSKLKTYTEKKQNYLYIDSFEFIADAQGNYKGSNRAFEIILPYIQAELERMIMFNNNREYYNTVKGFSEKVMDNFSMFDDILTEDTKKALKNSDIAKELNKGLYKHNATEEEQAEYLNNKDTTLKDILRVVNPDLLVKVRGELTAYFNKLNAEHSDVLLDKYGYVSPQTRETIVNNMNGPKLDMTNSDDIRTIDDAALRSFTYNTWINNAEIIMLYNGGLTSYDHTKDEATKRFPLFQSSGDMFPTDLVSQNIINRMGTPLTKSVTGADIKFDGTMNTAVIKDREVTREHVYSLFHELFKRNFEKKGLTGVALTEELYGRNKEGELGTYEKPFGGAMKSYKNPTTTDGQGYITLDAYRILRKLEAKWSDKQEILYQKIVAKQPIGLDDVAEYFPVYKLQYAGALKTEPGLLPITAGHKFALFPLIPGLGFYALDELHETMMKQGVHYVTHSSGSKLQSITDNTNTKGDRGDQIFDEKTGSVIPDKVLTKNTIFVDFLKNQTDVNTEFKGKSTMSTQLRTLLSSGLIKNGMPIDFIDKNSGLIDTELLNKWEGMSEEEQMEDSPYFKYVRTYEKRVTTLVEQKKDDLLSKLAGWKKTANGRYTGPQSSVIEYILKELKAQGMTDQELSFIAYDGKGSLLRDLSGSSIADVLEKKLMALINNKILKQNVTGEPFVEVSSANTTDLRFKGVEVDAAIAKYGNNGLLSFYGPDVDGKKNTIACQVKIAMQGSFVNLFNLTDNENKKIAVYVEKDGKRILDFEASRIKLNSLITNEEWLAKDDNRKKLRLTGVRIPVQGLNSMEYAEIAEFLPSSAGNIIILPEEIVAKSGTDFDVDKLTTYMPTIGKNGTWLYNKYSSRQQLDAEIKTAETALQALLKDKVGEKETAKELIKEYRTGKKDKGLTIIALKLNRDLLTSEISNHIANIKAFIKEEHYENKINAGLLRLMNTEDDDVARAIITGFINKPTILSRGAVSTAFDAVVSKAGELKDIKSTLKESYEDKTDYLKEDPEINELFNHYSELMDYKRNFIKSIENSLINDIISILELPENAVRLLTANDTHKTKPLADVMQKYVQDTDFKKSFIEGKSSLESGISPTRLLEYLTNLKKHEDNFVSKEALGIAALGNKGNSVYNSAGAFIPAEVPFKNTYEGKDVFTNIPTKIYLETNKMNVMVDGKETSVVSLSHLYDSLNEHEISEIISQLMNGYVDSEKDAWIAYIQGNKEVTPIILFLLETGVPFRDIVHFVSNPLVREYVQKLKIRKGLLTKLVDPINDVKFAKPNAKRDVWRLLKAAKTVRTNDVPNMVAIARTLDAKYGEQTFNSATLESIAQSTLDQSARDSAAVDGFMHYLYIEELTANFNEPRNKTNLDTNKSSTLFDVHKAQSLIDELYQSTKMPLKIIKYIVETGPTSAFRITELAQDLFGSLFKLRNSEQVNDYIFEMIKNFAATERLRDTTGINKEMFPAKYKNAMMSYLFVNNLKSFVMGESKYYKGFPVKYVNTGDKVVSIAPEKIDMGPAQLVITINENLLRRDFKNDNYTKEAIGKNSYKEQRLAPMGTNVFYKNAGNDKLLGAKAYYNFVVEREYMRTLVSLDDFAKTHRFKARFSELTEGPKPSFTRKSNQSHDDFIKKISKIVYEEYLRNSALENSWNFNTLFFNNQDHGIHSYASTLLKLIRKYEKNLLEKYSILNQISSQYYQDDVVKASGGYLKDLVNITLRDSNDLSPENIVQYSSELAKLANSNVVKIVGDTDEIREDNERLSELFRKFPTYIFLQGGMNKNQFAFPSIFPTNSSQADIMNNAVIKARTNPTLLNNIFNLFLGNNIIGNKKFNQRYTGPMYEQPTGAWEFKTIEEYADRTTIISSYDTFDRLTETSIEGVYTVNTKDITPKEMAELANEYRQAQFVTEDGSFSPSNLDVDFTSKEAIDNSIQNIIAALGSGIPVIFDEKGYGQNLGKELRSYLTQQLSEKIGVANHPGPAILVPGVKVINETDIGSFKSYVSKSGGTLPKEFFTSTTSFKVFFNPESGKREKAPQSAKWILNTDNLYDLVDKEAGEVYIENVDLNTGMQMIVKPITQAPITPIRPAPDKVVSGDIFAISGIPVITTNLGGVHGAGLAQLAKGKGLIKQGNGDFIATDKVVQLPVKKVWSDSMTMNNNMELLKSSLRSLIQVARENPLETYLLPLAGLGHGEGKVEDILPLLIKTVQAAENIKLVLPGENVDLGRKGTVRKDTTREKMPVIKQMLEASGLISPSVVLDKATSLLTYRGKSGGANQSDAEWDIEGLPYGVTFDHYLLPEDGPVADKRLVARGVLPVSAEEFRIEGQQKVTIAARQMGRIEPSHQVRNAKLIRNWAQVKNADAVFAITSMLKPGDEMNYGKKALISQGKGGTGYAIQMAINEGKPVYVFNQKDGKWYKNITGKWENSDIPVLTKNFAGIGTSKDLTEAGKQAIRDVYQKTFDTLADNTFKCG